MVFPAALAVLAYLGTGSFFLWASAAVLAAVVLLAESVRLILPDWAIELALVYEIPSLANASYAANGSPYAKVLCAAAVCYFLVRLSARTVSQIAAVSILAGAGGVALAWFALTQAGEHILGLQTIGFSDIVAFRWRLIVPPAPWVAGEWFTLLLLTLPFALAAVAFLLVAMAPWPRAGGCGGADPDHRRVVAFLLSGRVLGGSRSYGDGRWPGGFVQSDFRQSCGGSGRCGVVRVGGGSVCRQRRVSGHREGLHKEPDVASPQHRRAPRDLETVGRSVSARARLGCRVG